MSKAPFAFFMIVVTLLLTFTLSYPLTIQATSRDVTFTVLAADIKRIGEQDRYLVSVQYLAGSSRNPTYGPVETVEVADNWFFGNFTSADMYFMLKNSAGSDTVFHARVGGWRVGILSWFPYLISAKPAVILEG